jgi:hypothetical protein
MQVRENRQTDSAVTAVQITLQIQMMEAEWDPNDGGGMDQREVKNER